MDDGSVDDVENAASVSSTCLDCTARNNLSR